ncbi:hypothetical protein AAU57_06575 [Nonlabens sp. YIK11]|uniref:hypothetical protein n=1 Tax=Nonlabens sp. YIK11 TaxID=1453349 RepID=UPI0006DD1CEB|nr:hypothetical protein [Nonlabens sp. YIK11]KQC33022.1 hypothetical protein AAU57_06575 [Nonlabens sp. YIK11]
MIAIRYCFLLVFILSSGLIQAQELLAESYFKPSRLNSEVVTVIDNDSMINLFAFNNKKIHRLKYSADFRLLSSTDYDAPRSRYGEVAGYAVQEDGTIQLYYSNSRGNKFSLNAIQEGQGQITVDEFDFKFDEDIQLEHFTHQNRFYILAINRNSTLKLFEFDGASYTVEEYPQSSMSFDLTSNGKAGELFDFFVTGNAFKRTEGDLQWMDTESPNSIESVSVLNKLYTIGDRLYITLDKADENTYVIEISLADKTIKTTTFPQPAAEFDRATVKSNSYLYDGKLFQNIVSRDRLITTVTDYETRSQIKRLDIARDDELTIANSSIIQEGGTYDDYRELEKTSKLLRKMTSATPGISVYKMNGDYELTIGGSKEVSAAPMVGFGFGGGATIPIGGGNSGIGLTFISLSPTWHAYNAYTNTKSTYFISMFDQQMNHLDGEVRENVFDKINTYVEDKNPMIETVFRYDDSFIYAYFDKRQKKHILVGFRD